MTSFNVTDAKAFLQKAHDEQKDFVASNCLSARHALNAIITAYHLREWVWGECKTQHPALVQQWGLSTSNDEKDFGAYLIAHHCPALDDARKITNGTKHFGLNKIPTGAHQGAFQRNAFQANAFDVSYLWIDRNGQKQKAEDFIRELLNFWDQFFSTYSL